MAAARLRRTFQYPTESDDEDAVEEGMDEQDQEDLITNLSSKDTSSTRIYTLLILILPLAPVLLYLPRLFSLSTIIPSMIAITSLISTAYTLYFLPLPPVKVSVFTPIDGKREDRVKAKGKSINRSSYGYRVPPITSQSPQHEGRSPVPYIPGEIAELLEKYIVPANGVFCILLAVHELFQGRTWSEGMEIGGGYVPGLILTTILWARRELRAVDMGELEKLRYRTKH